jgi:hypothetical protein
VISATSSLPLPKVGVSDSLSSTSPIGPLVPPSAATVLPQAIPEPGLVSMLVLVLVGLVARSRIR